MATYGYYIKKNAAFLNLSPKFNKFKFFISVEYKVTPKLNKET